LEGENLFPGGCRPHEPLRLSPHRGEQEGSSPFTRETKRGSSPFTRETKRGSSPFTGETKRGSSPFTGETKRGSCGAGVLRFPHRSTDPRGEGEHRSPAGLPPSFRKARTQESQNSRGPKIRGHVGAEASAGGCGVFRLLLGRSQRGPPSTRAGTTSVRKVYGMSL